MGNSLHIQKLCAWTMEPSAYSEGDLLLYCCCGCMIRWPCLQGVETAIDNTAASVPKPGITDGVQLLQGIQWYLLVTLVSWCSCSCRCQCLCWAAETHRPYTGDCRAVWEVMDINCLCQLSIWTTLHPVCQSWPDLVSLADVTGSGCEGSNESYWQW